MDAMVEQVVKKKKEKKDLMVKLLDRKSVV